MNESDIPSQVGQRPVGLKGTLDGFLHAVLLAGAEKSLFLQMEAVLSVEIECRSDGFGHNVDALCSTRDVSLVCFILRLIGYYD
jgi:hypothetical protein